MGWQNQFSIHPYHFLREEEHDNNAHIPDLTHRNANVVSYIRYVGRSNGNFSPTLANVANCIRYAGCYIAIAGDRINM